MNLYPSLEVWNYFNGDLSGDLVASLIADKLAGYHISYSGQLLLEDLGLITTKGNINKKGIQTMATQIHYRYHHNKDEVKIIEPNKDKK